MQSLAIACGSGWQANEEQNTVRGNTAAHTTHKDTQDEQRQAQNATLPKNTVYDRRNDETRLGSVHGLPQRTKSIYVESSILPSGESWTMVRIFTKMAKPTLQRIQGSKVRAQGRPWPQQCLAPLQFECCPGKLTDRVWLRIPPQSSQEVRLCQQRCWAAKRRRVARCNMGFGLVTNNIIRYSLAG